MKQSRAHLGMPIRLPHLSPCCLSIRLLHCKSKEDLSQWEGAVVSASTPLLQKLSHKLEPHTSLPLSFTRLFLLEQLLPHTILSPWTTCSSLLDFDPDFPLRITLTDHTFQREFSKGNLKEAHNLKIKCSVCEKDPSLNWPQHPFWGAFLAFPALWRNSSSSGLGMFLPCSWLIPPSLLALACAWWS